MSILCRYPALLIMIWSAFCQAASPEPKLSVSSPEGSATIYLTPTEISKAIVSGSPNEETGSRVLAEFHSRDDQYKTFVSNYVHLSAAEKASFVNNLHWLHPIHANNILTEFESGRMSGFTAQTKLALVRGFAHISQDTVGMITELNKKQNHQVRSIERAMFPAQIREPFAGYLVITHILRNFGDGGTMLGFTEENKRKIVSYLSKIPPQVSIPILEEMSSESSALHRFGEQEKVALLKITANRFASILQLFHDPEEIPGHIKSRSQGVYFNQLYRMSPRPGRTTPVPLILGFLSNLYVNNLLQGLQGLGSEPDHSSQNFVLSGLVESFEPDQISRSLATFSTEFSSESTSPRPPYEKTLARGTPQRPSPKCTGILASRSAPQTRIQRSPSHRIQALCDEESLCPTQ